MKIANSETMNKIDKYCVEQLGIPSIVLMENAALKLLKHIITDIQREDIQNNNVQNNKTVTIICGKGNNGGDGFALARHLSIAGVKVEVFMVDAYNKFSKDCKTNYEILSNMDIEIKDVHNVEDVNELRDSLNKSDIIVDAIFGTGLKREVEGIFDHVISIINENSKFTVSIDVPSGFDSNTGKIFGNSIRADKTITFQLYKKGFLNYDTDIYTGEIVVENIGIPEWVVDKFHGNEYIVDMNMIHENLKQRNKYSHKGDYGKVLIFAGSPGFSGAPIIASNAAVRSGAGLVTLCCYDDIFEIVQSKVLEQMTISLSDDKLVEEKISKSDVIAVGPGMGKNETTFKVLKRILDTAKCPLVIDADGLNVLQNNVSILKGYGNKIIVTPHLGEMARLTGLDIEYIRDNRLAVAKEFAMEYNCIVLLKGYHSILTDGNYTIINPTGNSSMASGGMGDCLTGMIASFIGQGYEPLTAASIAAFVHGYSGEKLSKEMYSVNASHIIENIPYVIKKMQNTL